MKTVLKQIYFWICLILVLAVISFIGWYFLVKEKALGNIFLPAQISETLPENNQQNEKETITLSFVGDIMLDRGVELMIKKEGEGDFKFPFLKTAEELEKADILFGNLESVISDKGVKVGSIYSFRAEPQAIEGLTYAGFDILSVANNHAFDYTRQALEDSLKRLKEAGIEYVGGGFNGNEAYSPVIKEVSDSENSTQTRIGFLAYTNLGSPSWEAKENLSGIAWLDSENIEKIKKEIREAKNEVDILIVSLHSGIEYSLEPSQFQVFFAKTAIESGADLVVGHHSHVIQPLEKYKNGWIAYGLGNFVFDQSFSEETMESQILNVLIEDEKIKEVVPINIKINSYFQPEIVR